jgi:hypothetical protein
MELVIFGFRKKRQWLIRSAYAAIANLLRGSFPNPPENQRRKIKWDVVEETPSLKLRYGAGVMLFGVSPWNTQASTRSRKKIKQRDYEISRDAAETLL